MVEVLDLGMHPFADRFIPHNRASSPDTIYPLIVDQCADCGFVQARTITPPIERYTDYSYLSAHSESARRFWDKYAADVTAEAGLSAGALVVEAGSNDGYLCEAFGKRGMRTLGVDPSEPMNRLAAERGVDTRTEFFRGTTANWIAQAHGEAALVIANNVLNHADDLVEFVAAAEKLLAKDGLFVFQVPSWLHMAREANFDQVYHEHISYFTVLGAMRLLKNVGMSVVRVEEVDYHGTSLRVFGRRGTVTPDAVRKRAEEDSALDIKPRVAEALHMRAVRLRAIYTAVADGKGPIVCAGASAKGNTFLNWHGLDRSVVACVTDVAPTKVGKFTPGSRIPIVTDEVLANYDTPHVLLTAWNFAEPIRRNIRRINPKSVVLDPSASWSIA